MDLEQTVLNLRLKIEKLRKEKAAIKKEYAHFKLAAQRTASKSWEQGHLAGYKEGQRNLQDTIARVLGLKSDED